jgi:hypothetical protein
MLKRIRNIPQKIDTWRRLTFPLKVTGPQVMTIKRSDLSCGADRSQENDKKPDLSSEGDRSQGDDE